MMTLEGGADAEATQVRTGESHKAVLFTTDFQAACRARAAKKHKELMARALQSTTLRERERESNITKIETGGGCRERQRGTAIERKCTLSTHT